MYYAIAHQSVEVYGRHFTAEQTIHVPAAGIAFNRTVSERHPRSTWRKRRSDVWKTRGTQEYTHTAELFQITDAELLEMTSGTLPRNVVLRYQRALVAADAQLLGKGLVAGHRPVVDVPALLRSTFVRLGRADDVSTADAKERRAAYEEYVGVLENMIRRDDSLTLARRTSRGCRANDGGSPHRTHEYFESYVAAGGAMRKMMDAADPAPAPAPVAAPVKVAAGSVAPGDLLVRPNGEHYMALKVDAGIKGLSDVQMYRDAAAAGEHILTLGEPGAGKTAALEVAFPGMVTMVGTNETEASDFIGSYVATVDADGREVLTWEDGPLVRAMEGGYMLYVDEIGIIPPNQLTVLYQVMDGRKELTITANPARGIVRMKEGFGVVASINPNAPGVRMSEALLSRFDMKVWVSTDYEVMRKLGVDDRMVDMALHLAKLVDAGEASWAPQSREMLRFQRQKESRGLILALQSFLTNVPGEEMDVIVGIVRERWGDVPGAAKLIRPMKIGN